MAGLTKKERALKLKLAEETERSEIMESALRRAESEAEELRKQIAAMIDLHNSNVGVLNEELGFLRAYRDRCSKFWWGIVYRATFYGWKR